MFTKDKIINHLTGKGKKTKGEKILNKSIKELQKNSKKQTKRLIQLSLILSSVIFKIRTLKNKNKKKKKTRKKKVKIKPIFIVNQNKRFSFAIKLIVLTAKENSANCFYNKLKNEFFSTALSKSHFIKTKKSIEKQALKQKNLFKYYRWT